MNKRERGSAYENRASLFLEKNGVKVIERNFRCRMGEIDIIGIEPKDKELVFVEVKYIRLRQSVGSGGFQKTEYYLQCVRLLQDRAQAIYGSYDPI